MAHRAHDLAFTEASREVAKGRESAAALLQALHSQKYSTISHSHHPDGDVRDLAEQILGCFDRALAALALPGGSCSTRKRSPEHGPSATSRTTSPKRIRASNGEQMATRVEKKYTTEDGFRWRKYGQKDIRDSKYPRLYFRCTYMNDRGCMARKQVQQSDGADPFLYTVTYFGEHTCCHCPDEAVVVDDGHHDDVSKAILVIDFGSSDTVSGGGGANRQRFSVNGDAPRSDGETTSLVWSLPEEEELLADLSKLDQLIEGSTPVHEVMCLSSPDLVKRPVDECLDWELGEGSFDMSEFINFDYHDIFE